MDNFTAGSVVRCKDDRTYLHDAAKFPGYVESLVVTKALADVDVVVKLLSTMLRLPGRA